MKPQPCITKPWIPILANVLQTRCLWTKTAIIFCLTGMIAVCELLLDTKEPLKFETEQGKEYTFSELMKLLFPDNRQNYDYHFHITDKQWDTLLDNFRDTEPIDDEWPKELDRLKKIYVHHVLENQDILQKIFEYIFFRQIERIPEYGIKVVLQFAKECTDFVAIHAQLTRDYKKSLRRFSEQIEYSDVNVDILDNGIRSRYQA